MSLYAVDVILEYVLKEDLINCFSYVMDEIVNRSLGMVVVNV